MHSGPISSKILAETARSPCAGWYRQPHERAYVAPLRSERMEGPSAFSLQLRFERRAPAHVLGCQVRPERSFGPFGVTGS